VLVLQKPGADAAAMCSRACLRALVRWPAAGGPPVGSQLVALPPSMAAATMILDSALSRAWSASKQRPWSLACQRSAERLALPTGYPCMFFGQPGALHASPETTRRHGGTLQGQRP